MVVGVDGQVGVAVAQGSGSYERPTILCENRRRDFPSQKKLQLARRSASYSTIFCTLVPTYLCLTTSNHPTKSHLLHLSNHLRPFNSKPLDASATTMASTSTHGSPVKSRPTDDAENDVVSTSPIKPSTRRLSREASPDKKADARSHRPAGGSGGGGVGSPKKAKSPFLSGASQQPTVSISSSSPQKPSQAVRLHASFRIAGRVPRAEMLTSHSFLSSRRRPHPPLSPLPLKRTATPPQAPTSRPLMRTSKP